MTYEIKESHFIKVKGGRAYLHSEYQGGTPGGIKHISCSPLGSDPKLIAKMSDKFGAEIVYE